MDLLIKYQEKFTKTATAWLEGLEGDSLLKKSMAYSLLSPGKRMRPAIVWAVADALSFLQEVSFSALSMEFFHTASLIADDLPCMDNDAKRRNQPTLHKAFGEPLALLTSYALISAGYDCLAKNGLIFCQKNQKEGGERLCLAIQNVSENTGINGACGGQLLDVLFKEPSLPAFQRLMHKKTGVLFEASFVLGWLFGGGALEKLPLLKKAAYHFGQVFQIRDDLEDVKVDKTKGKQTNLAVFLGESKTKELLEKEKTAYLVALKGLDLDKTELNKLCF